MFKKLIKNTMSYGIYVLRINPTEFQSFAWPLLFFCIGLVIFFLTKGIYNTIGLVVAVVALVYEVFKMIKSITKPRVDNMERRKILKIGDSIVNLADIDPNNLDKAYEYQKRKLESDEPVLYSEQINEWLRKNDLPVQLDDMRQERLYRHIKKNRDILIPILTRQYLAASISKVFINDKKLCLTSEPDPNRAYIQCHYCGYYDSFLTNEACTIVLNDPISGDPHIDGTKLFPVTLDKDGAAHLAGLSESIVGNHIGISTLGFTDDGKLCIWEQNDSAMVNEGFLVSTGSGSCDAEDLCINSFHETLKKAMTRELEEESFSDNTYIRGRVGQTQIIGYFRWIRRGGKPEFLGITRIKVDLSQLEPNESEVRSPAGKLENIWPARNIDELMKSLESIRNRQKISVPLLMNILALENFSTNNPSELNEFLNLSD